jgi:hypothetical protein
MTVATAPRGRHPRAWDIGRRLFPALLSGALLFGSPILPASRVALAQDDICVDGWRSLTFSHGFVPQAVVMRAEGGAWLAGGEQGRWGVQQPAARRLWEGTWQAVGAPAPGTRDSGFMDLASAGPNAPLWAVGYARTTQTLAAYTARWDEGGWSAVRTFDAGRDGATLSSVDASPGLGTWAAGYRQDRPGQQLPWIVRWRGDGWVSQVLPLDRGESATLAGISVTGAGVWAVGTVLRGASMHPYILRRTGDRWRRQKVGAAGRAALADIAMTSPRDGWAVGHRIAGSRLAPLVLHWDGDAWRRVRIPGTRQDAVVLTGVSVTPTTVTAVGAAWDREAGHFVPFVATLSGEQWTVTASGGDWWEGGLTGVAGDPSRDGWAVGRRSGAGVGMVARTCDDASEAEAAQVVRDARRGASQLAIAIDDTEGESGEPPRPLNTPGPPDATPSTVAAAESADASASPAAPASAAASPSPRVRSGRITLSDEARSMGLPIGGTSYGTVVADFDGDGHDDVFIGRHGGPALLYLWREGHFERSTIDFGSGDRHGCAAADVDGSGLPDLYCSFGASRGTSTKSNQLWLDPGGPLPRTDPVAGGALEPFGRGRLVRLLDLDEDGDEDLFLGQETKRMDGLPSPVRVYENSGDGSFAERPVPGLRTGLTAWAADTGDVDGDGRTDLLYVYFDQQARDPRQGLLLYRNLPGSLGVRDVASQMGIRSIGEVDAALADLDADGQPDLVQLSEGRLVVSLQRDGRFRSVAEREVPRAVAVAPGDADGDGDLDLYVLRDQVPTLHDLLLLNRGDGRRWRVVPVPTASRVGSADDVVAVDPDGDGRDAFLVQAGINGRGTLRYITLHEGLVPEETASAGGATEVGSIETAGPGQGS